MKMILGTGRVYGVDPPGVVGPAVDGVAVLVETVGVVGAVMRSASWRSWPRACAAMQSRMA
jgi:hypothetical protein